MILLMGMSLLTTFIFRPFCCSMKDLTLMTFPGRDFSIWDLTMSMLEMMPTSFLSSSTTGRFLSP